MPSYVLPLSLFLGPLLLVGAIGFAGAFYRENTAPVGCAGYAIILIFGAGAGYLFGIYYGGGWIFHSGRIECGESGVACALLSIVAAGPLASAFAIVCVAVFIGRR